MENVVRDFTSFGLGGLVVGGALLFAFLRKPKFRTWVLGWKVFGKSLIKITMLTMTFLACTNGYASERDDSPPSIEPTIVKVMGPNLIAIISWTPGTTDSITFIAERPPGSVVATASGVRPFSGVDTLLLGARPLPGVTATWDIRTAFWWTNTGTATFGSEVLGSVSWTEPQPAGVRPNFGAPSIDSTGGGSATGPGNPVGIFMVFTDAQVQAMDTIPSCKAAQITACVTDMETVGVIDTAIGWPKWACGVYAGYDSSGWASFKSVAGPDSAWNTHSCNRELAILGYDSASVALYAVVDSLAAGVWLASVGPITRWFATRF